MGRDRSPLVSSAAIALAAGAGTRMGAGMPKALLPVAGRPLLCWSLDALVACDAIERVVLVVPEGQVRATEAAIGGASAVDSVVVGGSSRARSVAAGLEAVGSAERVLVHDTARPLLGVDLIERVLAAVEGADGALAAVPLADTLKRAAGDLSVAATVDRAGLWQAQTPQAFPVEELRRAIAAAEREDRLDGATDCSSLVEAVGGRVRLVPTGAANLKLTTPADLDIIERLLSARGSLPGSR